MDVADTCCQHINAEVSDHLALVRICALAHTDHAVFLAADGSNLCLEGHSLFTADTDQFFCLFNVLFDRIMRTVKHDGGESGIDAL